MKNKIIENKVALSFREDLDTKVLYRLFNTKRSNTKSFEIYEKAKFSKNILEAFNNDYRKIDIDYDTLANKRFKKANLIIDKASYLNKEIKNELLDITNSNKIFFKTNKVSNEILELNKYFEAKILAL
jgi:hypothetical protein|tara:strand:- start:62 stop:445 length:384 start_codon:yes stop_codon:yes gene_type:complete